VKDLLRPALARWLRSVVKRIREEGGDEQDHR
jgi:hypothetical protein